MQASAAPGIRSSNRWLVLLFLGWALWLSAECLVFGPLSYVRVHDNGDGILPMKIAVAGAVRDGTLPGWFVQGGCGTDLLATAGSIDLDLLLFAVVPPWLAAGLWLLLQRLIAGYFTFRVLSEQLETGPLPALYGGFVYALFAQGWLNHSAGGFTLYDALSAPALPFLVWFLPKLSSWRPGRRFAGAAALGLLVALTSTYVFEVFVLATVALWFALVRRDLLPAVWVPFGVLALAWAVAEIPTAFPALVNAAASHRAAWALQPWSTGVIAEARMLGAAAGANWVAILMGAGALLLSNAQRLRRIAQLVVLTALLTILGPVLQRLVGIVVPGLSGFQLDRFYLSLPFLLTVLGAVGIDELGTEFQLTRRRRVRDVPVAAVLSAVAILLAVSTSVAVKRDQLRALSLGHSYRALYERSEYGALTHLASSPSGESRVAVVVDSKIPGVQPSMLWPSGLETAGGYLNLYSGAYHRFWELALEPTRDSEGSRFRYFQEWGNRAYLFLPITTSEPSDEPLNTGDLFDLDLLSLANVRFIVSPRRLTGAGLAEVSLPTNTVDPSADPSSTAGRLRAMLLHGTVFAPRIYVYENTRAFSRAFLVSHFVSERSFAAAADAMVSAARPDLRRTAVLTPGAIDETAAQGDGGTGRVEVERLSADEVVMTVHAEGPGMVVISNTYSPFWVATVDGQNADVDQVDLTFQGVPVPAGDHRVVLRYQPPCSW